ncbi:MAG: YceI family protein [Pseudomonadota bacterium]
MRRLGLALAGLTLSACSTLPDMILADPIDAQLREAVASRDYAINPSTTEVRFVAGPTPVGLVEGNFEAFSGELVVRDATAGEADLTAVLVVNSAVTPSEFFQTTLLGPGWFEAEVWPEARFDGRLMGWNEDGSGNVVGTMTIRDISREETFRLVLTCDGIEACPENAIGFEGQTVLDRTAYGMTRMQGLVGKDVQITVSGQLNMEAMDAVR